MRNILLSIIGLLALCASCAGSDSIGQYVYVDYFAVIHIDRKCASKVIENPKTKEERMANMEGVSFIDTCNLISTTKADYEYTFCPRCINDGTYRHLSSIMEQNEKLNHEAEKLWKQIDKARRWLYGKLYQTYDLPGYDDFVEDMVDNQKRKRIYDVALEEGLDVGSTFEEFSETLGFKQ
ncbi:MAG: hypothetical protein K1V84_01040 [Muribaculaceae bacterium]